MIFRRRPPADPIGAFWQWWPTARPRVEQAIDGGTWPDGLVADLNARVRAIDPDLEWEFGRGTSARHVLVVTAAGNRSLRAVAERWWRAGPPSDDTFEFAAARRPSLDAAEGTLTFGGVTLDLSALRFAAEPDDGAAVIHVTVGHPGFADVPDDVRWRVAFLALDWLLGEDGVEVWVGAIDVTVDPGPTLTPTALASLFADHAAAHRDGRWAILHGNGLLASIQVPLRPARWPAFDTHVRVTVPFRDLKVALPDLRDLEDRIHAYVDGAALVAHETTGGRRTFHLYADGPVPAEAVRPIIASWPHGRVGVAVRPDAAWDGIRHLRP